MGCAAFPFRFGVRRMGCSKCDKIWNWILRVLCERLLRYFFFQKEFYNRDIIIKEEEEAVSGLQ